MNTGGTPACASTGGATAHALGLRAVAAPSAGNALDESAGAQAPARSSERRTGSNWSAPAEH